MCLWFYILFLEIFLGYRMHIYIYMRGKSALLISEFLGIFCIKFPKTDRGVRAPPLGPFLATYQSEKKEKTKKLLYCLVKSVDQDHFPS
jgi:hypothetical protein